MRIGIYCGSFSPVHRGHIRIARACLRQRTVDEVWIVATGNYWEKQDLYPLDLRIRMLKIFEGGGIRIDTEHNEIPYTYELFRKIRKERPGDTPVLIVGADNLERFDEWREYRELLGYPFVIVPRSPVGKREIKAQMKRLGKEDYQILSVRNIPFSSTAIRTNLNNYEAVRPMLDKRVYRCLVEAGIAQGGSRSKPIKP